MWTRALLCRFRLSYHGNRSVGCSTVLYFWLTNMPGRCPNCDVSVGDSQCFYATDGVTFTIPSAVRFPWHYDTAGYIGHGINILPVLALLEFIYIKKLKYQYDGECEISLSTDKDRKIDNIGPYRCNYCNWSNVIYTHFKRASLLFLIERRACY